MIKLINYLIILLLGSFLAVSQDFSQYQEQLDMLPESVRNSVLQRINSSGFDLPQIEQGESILLEEEEEEEAAAVEEDDDLDKYDLLQKDYDRYGSLIPRPFGYDLFKNYKKTRSLSVESAPADYILGP